MKNLILMIIGVCIMSFSSYAQDGKRFSIGVSTGTGIPVGLWGKKDFQDSKTTGFTKLGASYDLSLAYQLGKGNYGVTTLIRRQINAVDTEAMANAYTINNGGADYSVNSDDWRVNQFLLGGFGTKSISEKIDIDVRALVGVVHVARPAMDVFDRDLNFSSSTGTSSSAIGFSIGTGIKYHLGKRLDFLVNADYLGTQPEFDVENSLNSESIGNSIFSQNISSINLSVGIAVKL